MVEVLEVGMHPGEEDIVLADKHLVVGTAQLVGTELEDILDSWDLSTKLFIH